MTSQRVGVALLGILIGISMTALGVRVFPASYHLDQKSGTIETYSLTALNDTDVAEELTLYRGDWQRFEDGEHDWGMPINGACWIFDRPFTAGETLEIACSLPSEGADGLTMSGIFEFQSPQSSNTTGGPSAIQSGSTDVSAPPASAATMRVSRANDSNRDDGLVTLQLIIQCLSDFDGLVIYKATSERVALTCVNDADGRFDTINRSNADWLTLSHDRLVLHALFENTGNLEPVVTGEVQVIDRTGQRVRDFNIDEFKVPPGAKRVVAVTDSPDSDALLPDVYQAVVSFDYGGDNPVVGSVASVSASALCPRRG